MTADLLPILDAVTASVAWLGGDGGIEDLERQVLKVGEEHGEGAEAWFGLRGSNPRKGRTHSDRDVAIEMADVVLTSLVALSSGHYSDVLHSVLADSIDAARDIERDSERDVTRALLRVQHVSGLAAEAVLDLTPAVAAARICRLVVVAVAAIACLGFDPAEVLTAKAKAVSARIAEHQAAEAAP